MLYWCEGLSVETIGEEMTEMSFYFDKKCKCDDICMNAMKIQNFKSFKELKR